jgi:hypothetical protein
MLNEINRGEGYDKPAWQDVCGGGGSGSAPRPRQLSQDFRLI